MADENTSVRAAADHLASKYSAYYRYDEITIRRFLNSILTLSKDPTGPIIDIGAGTGEPSRIMSTMSRRVVAFDLSRDMLARVDSTQSLAPVAGDAYSLPFKDGCASVALFVESLHLMKDTEAALREASRVMATDGAIAIIDTLREDLELQVFHKFFPEFFALDSARHLSLNDIVSMVDRQSLTIRRIQTHDFEIRFQSAGALIEFVKTRPFFGLRQLPDEVFMRGFQRFATVITDTFPRGTITSRGRESCIILGG